MTCSQVGYYSSTFVCVYIYIYIVCACTHVCVHLRTACLACIYLDGRGLHFLALALRDLVLDGAAQLVALRRNVGDVAESRHGKEVAALEMGVFALETGLR